MLTEIVYNTGLHFNVLNTSASICNIAVNVNENVFLLLFLKTQFLIQECASLITKPNFISTLSYAIDNPLHYQKVGIVFVFSSPKNVIS